MKNFYALLLLMAVIVGGIFTANYIKDLQSQIKSYGVKNDMLNRQVEYQKIVIVNKESEISETLSSKKSLESKNASYKTKVAKLEGKVDSLEVKLDIKKKKEIAKKKEEESQKQSSAIAKSDTSSSSSGKAIEVTATAYTADCNGCSGITKTGFNVRNTTKYQGNYVIATDPRVIPLFSRVKLETNNRTYIATAIDTGGAIKNNRIDLLVGSHGEAVSFGRQRATVTILK
ncbi:3D domain-containing protein [Pseudobutyrivibrio sp.]